MKDGLEDRRGADLLEGGRGLMDVNKKRQCGDAWATRECIDCSGFLKVKAIACIGQVE